MNFSMSLYLNLADKENWRPNLKPNLKSPYAWHAILNFHSWSHLVFRSWEKCVLLFSCMNMRICWAWLLMSVCCSEHWRLVRSFLIIHLFYGDFHGTSVFSVWRIFILKMRSKKESQPWWNLIILVSMKVTSVQVVKMAIKDYKLSQVTSFHRDVEILPSCSVYHFWILINSLVLSLSSTYHVFAMPLTGSCTNVPCK